MNNPVVQREVSRPVRIVALAGIVALFFLSLDLTSRTVALAGQDEAAWLVGATQHPVVGLFLGLLATAIVQSSSVTTALVVALVAGGGLTVGGAIPLILGANIGTTVTSTLVTLGHATRRDEFGRALAGATVHDAFNIFAVAVFLPLELATGFLARSAEALTSALGGFGGADVFSPLAALTAPLAQWIYEATGQIGVPLGKAGALALVLAGALLGLFVSVRLMVTVLRGLLVRRSEGLLQRYLFTTPARAFSFGAAFTALVQSSSLTTAVAVPIVGAGVLSARQVFPYVLGANLGTTIAAILGALALAATGSELGRAAINVALVHVLFNAFGVALVMGVPRVQAWLIWLSERLGRAARERRRIAVAYVVGVFYLLPLAVILLAQALGLLG
jgi:sodium-dependent phosphate cotransporter